MNGAPIIRRVISGDRAVEYEMRPLFQCPTWDGKLVLAALFFIGYYSLVWRISAHDIPAANVQLIRDQLLVLGPALGVIVGALYRNTAAEERKDERQAEALKTAIVTPTTVAPAEIGDQVETGAREGARKGVAEGLDGRTDEDPGILT